MGVENGERGARAYITYVDYTVVCFVTQDKAPGQGFRGRNPPP